MTVVDPSQPLKMMPRIGDGLVNKNAQRMAQRIVFLERELSIARDWIADLYEKNKKLRAMRGNHDHH